MRVIGEGVASDVFVRTVIAVWGIACAIALSGCAHVAASDSSSDVPVQGGSLTVGLQTEPSSLNPYVLTGGIVDPTILNPLTDPLIDFAPDGHPIPVVATRVPTLANGGVALTQRGMTVTIPIDQRAAWSDGVPLRCTDIRFTWQTLTDQRWTITTRAGWDLISSVTCPTPTRAVLHFTQRYGAYLGLLGQYLLPEHDLAGTNFNRAWSDNVPVSNGPFILASWRHGVSATLVRNPHYWRASDGSLPHLDQLTFRFFQDRNTLDLQLSTHEVDVVSRLLDQTAADQGTSFPDDAAVVTPSSGFQGLTFNTAAGPLADRRVRQAVAYAIDRQQIVASILGPPFAVLNSTVVPQLGDASTPAFEGYRPVPQTSRELLEQAGYERDGDGNWNRDGAPLRLRLRTTGEAASTLLVAQLIQAQLARAGITVDVALQAPQLFYGHTLPGHTFDLILWSMGSGLNPVQRSYFACPNNTRSNVSGYCNPAVDATMDQADATLDPVARDALVRTAQGVIATDVPTLPLYQEPWTTITAQRVHGIHTSANAGPGWDAADWWVDQ